MNYTDPVIAFGRFFQAVALGLVLGSVVPAELRRGTEERIRNPEFRSQTMNAILSTQAATGAPSATPTGGPRRPEDAAVGHSNDGLLSGATEGCNSPSGLQSKAGAPERAVGAEVPAAHFPVHLVVMDTLSVALTLRRALPWLARNNMRLAREYSLCRWVTDETLNELRKGART